MCTAEGVSFGLSHHRISSIGSKLQANPKNSIIHPGRERRKHDLMLYCGSVLFLVQILFFHDNESELHVWVTHGASRSQVLELPQKFASREYVGLEQSNTLTYLHHASTLTGRKSE